MLSSEGILFSSKNHVADFDPSWEVVAKRSLVLETAMRVADVLGVKIQDPGRRVCVVSEEEARLNELEDGALVIRSNAHPWRNISVAPD